MAFQSALFFDNDLGHCLRFAPWSSTITPFHVGGIEAHGEFPVTTWPNMEAYRQGLSIAGQNFMSYLQASTAPSLPADQGDVIDLSSGLTFEQCQFIIAALERKTVLHGVPANTLVIFDFDRTLSLFEGFMGADSPPVPPGSGIQGYLTYLMTNWPTLDAEGNPVLLSADGFIEYMLGGQQRKEMIQAFIHELVLLGHSIVILTNNSVGLNNPEMLKQFFPGNEGAINVICSRLYNGNKPLALRTAHPMFMSLFAAQQPPVNQFIITMDREPGQNTFVRRNYFMRAPPVSEVVSVDELYPIPALGNGAVSRRRSTRKLHKRKQSRRHKN
jgi:hypothetical protein